MARAFSIAILCVLIGGCQSKPKITDANSKSNAQGDPKLMKPTVKRIWIPRKIEDDGKVMEDGHWRYEVTGGSSWSN